MTRPTWEAIGAPLRNLSSGAGARDGVVDKGEGIQSRRHITGLTKDNRE